MKTRELLLWFAVIIALAVAINNLFCIREIIKIMDTMIETDQIIIDWMSYKDIMTLI